MMREGEDTEEWVMSKPAEGPTSVRVGGRSGKVGGRLLNSYHNNDKKEGQMKEGERVKREIKQKGESARRIGNHPCTKQRHKKRRKAQPW